MDKKKHLKLAKIIDDAIGNTYVDCQELVHEIYVDATTMVLEARELIVNDIANKDKEIELLKLTLKNQHKLMVNAEKRGYDKAVIDFMNGTLKVVRK